LKRLIGFIGIEFACFCFLF